MNLTKRQLTDIFHRCITDHICRAEQALRLAETIGENAWTINREGFGHLFQALQVALADEMTLSITNMLESVDKRYPDRRSIPVLLSRLEEHADHLKVFDRTKLEAFLVEAGRQASDVKSWSDAELTRALVAELRENLPRPKSFWYRRDKQIAHTGAPPERDDLRPEWDEARRLIEQAQQLAGLLGPAYIDFHFLANDGSYMLSGSNGEIAGQMTLVLERAGLLDSGKSERVHFEYRGKRVEVENRHSLWEARVTEDTPEPLISVGESLAEARAKIQEAIDQWLTTGGDGSSRAAEVNGA